MPPCAEIKGVARVGRGVRVDKGLHKTLNKSKREGSLRSYSLEKFPKVDKQIVFLEPHGAL